MKWNSLISTQNLKLAWRRINTGKNLQYKRFFREAYLVYESAADKHIKELHQALAAKSWNASHATRLYIPKASGLQRPLSLLEIEDQIVLQAIANKFSTKLREKRKRVERQTVFSNELTNPKNSIFFMEQWQSTYSAFQTKCINAFKQGLRWSADFDLAAYYDTISHDLLLSIESPLSPDFNTQDIVKEWLRIWSANTEKAMTEHGIPQGPIASNFLAEAFLLPIDLKLQKEKSFQYIRYVDDIRLFGKTKNEVHKAVILLEQECRHRGLIPQTDKYGIRKINSMNEALGSLPSIPPADKKDITERIMHQSKALKLLTSAVSGWPHRIVDKSRFRYVMYRAPENVEILKIVLRLLPRHPEHIDAFMAYFGNYGGRRRSRIVNRALDYLESEVPYSYVRGELWHIVARLGDTNAMKRGLPIARKDYKNRKQCVALSWGVMHFLMQYEDMGLASIGRRLQTEHHISRSLLAPKFAKHEFSPKGHVVTLLKGSLIEQLAGARELQKREITLNSLKLRQRDLPQSCRIALKSLGVIRRQRRDPKRDWIKESLVSLYDCNDIPIWRELLGAEYEYAWQILIEAKTRFDGAYSEWLSLQDSFNDIVIGEFYNFREELDLPVYSKTIDKKGNKVKYGILIAKNTPFDIHYPKESKCFRDLHQRRNQLPGQHPYDAKSHARSTWLKKREMVLLLPKVKIALDGIAHVVSTHLQKKQK